MTVELKTDTDTLTAREAYAYRFMTWAHSEFFSSETAPPYRLGFGQPPGARPKRNQRIYGACFSRAASSDGKNEMFFCPTESDTMNMLVTFLHEYCHAIDDCKSQHRGNFVRLANMCGLTAPYTSTPPSDELREVLEWYISEYGPIPAGHLKAAARISKPQKARMLKAECDSCGFLARVSRTQAERWVNGTNACPVCCKEITIHAG
jgi:hypothetical protein